MPEPARAHSRRHPNGRGRSFAGDAQPNLPPRTFARPPAGATARPATSSGHDRSTPSSTPLACPCHTSRSEVLRPPIESGQFTSLAFSQKLLDHGLNGSIGRVGTAYDNALMESTIGLYKTELIHADRGVGPRGRRWRRPPPPGCGGSTSGDCTPRSTTRAPPSSRRHTLETWPCQGRPRE